MRYWIVALFGLWASWLVFSYLTPLYGTAKSVLDYVVDTVNRTGVGFDPDVADALARMHEWFVRFWEWMPVAIFAGFVVYVILNSARRRVDEDVW